MFKPPKENIFLWKSLVRQNILTFGTPISRETFSFCENWLEKARPGLKHAGGQPVIEGPRKQAFLGFIITLESLLFVYRCYIQTNHLEYLLTFKFSQDHLEFFFSVIRASLGQNNNPTTTQVHCKSILKYSI